MNRRESLVLLGAGVSTWGGYSFLRSRSGSGTQASEDVPTGTSTPEAEVWNSSPGLNQTAPAPVSLWDRSETPTPEYDQSTTTESPSSEDNQVPTVTFETFVGRNQIEAGWNHLFWWTHHFESYSLHSSQVKLFPELIDSSPQERLEVIVVGLPYPDELRRFGEPPVYVLSRAQLGGTVGFSLAGQDGYSVAIETDVDAIPDRPFQLKAFVTASSKKFEDLTETDVELLCETDRLVVDSGRLKKSPHPDEAKTLIQDTYSRRVEEGAYVLMFTGTTLGKDWEVVLMVSKSGYIDDKSRIRNPERAAYVTKALKSGLADKLGSILYSAATDAGFSQKRHKAEFVIEFTQNLPYIQDTVGTGYRDYTKSVIETLVDAGGDCEDTAILMAAILESRDFNYDAVLLLLPGHMAVGVAGENDLPGSYYEFDGKRYYYLETTGGGWEVGEIPEEYENELAEIQRV